MLCPMKSNKSECDGDNCAWYIDGVCAIMAIASYLYSKKEEEDDYGSRKDDLYVESIYIEPNE